MQKLIVSSFTMFLQMAARRIALLAFTGIMMKRVAIGLGVTLQRIGAYLNSLKTRLTTSVTSRMATQGYNPGVIDYVVYHVLGVVSDMFLLVSSFFTKSIQQTN